MLNNIMQDARWSDVKSIMQDVQNSTHYRSLDVLIEPFSIIYSQQLWFSPLGGKVWKSTSVVHDHRPPAVSETW